MRLASTTSNGASPVGRLPARAETRRAIRLRRTFAVVASMAIGIGVDADRRAGTELDGRDREDPRAASDVQHARAAQVAAIGESLDGGETQARRRMEPGPERHPGIERQNDVAGRGAVTTPGRPDDDPLTDAHDREVRLPRVGPVRSRGRRGSAAHRSAGARTPGDGRAPRRPAATARSADARSRAGTYARTVAGRVTSTRAASPSLTSSNAGSTDVPPGADRPRISLTASTASTSASTAISSQAPGAVRPARTSPQPELLAQSAAARDVLTGILGKGLQQLALALRQPRRHDDVDQHVEIAAGSAAEMRDALASKPDLGLGLGSRA